MDAQRNVACAVASCSGMLDDPTIWLSRMTSSYTIVRATLDDCDALAKLFDAYRVFYEQASNPTLARDFVDARLRRNESVIFLACDATREALGFTQLYPTFSSVAARRVWILNDLFVAPAARQRGVARALMEAARLHAIETGALRLELETANDNHAAQALYESLGYVRSDGGCRHYALAIA